MRKTLKLIGWFCLFCIVIIGGLFTVKILVPSLTAFHASKPYLTIHLKPWNNAFQSIAFSPDGKQLIYLNRPDKKRELQRWDISTGKELPSIQCNNKNQDISQLSNDGRYYIVYNYVNHETSSQLYRISDQSIVGTLPTPTMYQSLYKIVGGDHPLAIYRYQESIRDDYMGRGYEVTNQKRRFYTWDVLAKHYLSPNPPTRMLYNYQYTSDQVAIADDGKKVLSIWPTYTTKKNGKTITVTKNFVHWIQNPPNEEKSIAIHPKEVSLLNELNGKIMTLPFPKEYTNPPSLEGKSYLTQDDEKYFLWFDFGWLNPALSPNQNLLAAMADHKWFENGEIWCYDLAHHNLKWRYYRAAFSPSKLQFSPDNKFLAAGGGSTGNTTGNSARLDQLNGTGILSVLDANTGELLHGFTEQTLWQQIRDRTQMEISRLKHLRQSDENKIRTQNVSHHTYPIPPVDASEMVGLIAWSPDSKFLAAAYEDGSVKIWRVK